MTDKYKNFAELSANENLGRDYEIEIKRTDSNILIMAPHGGKIEKYSCELAREIAGNEWSFYAFCGKKNNGNGELHITSHNFDEPNALELAANAERIVTIHGQKADSLMIGGLDKELAQRLKDALEEAGFEVRPPSPRKKAQRVDNICNRSRTGAGVQLELGSALRETRESRENFVRVVRDVLNEYAVQKQNEDCKV